MLRSSAYPWTYLESFVQGRRARSSFESVCTYAMFVGQPRSGTSLLGSLLNAHRNTCIAQELNALKFLRRKYNRDQIYWLIQARDREFGRGGRNWTGYQYQVPNQWQGRWDELTVIGDKKAGKSTEELARRPDLWDQLRRTLGIDVRVIQIVRNPFDVITTIHHKTRATLEEAVEAHFRRCQTNQRLVHELGDAMYMLRLEHLVQDPRGHLKQLCDFLGLPAEQGFLNDCASILFERPNTTKHRVAWPRALREKVQAQIDQFEYLQGYRYQNEPPAKKAVSHQAA